MSSFTPETSPFASDAAQGERSLALSAGPSQPTTATTEFLPREPANLEQTGLLPTDVEALVLKLLLTSGPTVGRKIAEQLRLPFGLISDLLRWLRAQRMV